MSDPVIAAPVSKEPATRWRPPPLLILALIVLLLAGWWSRPPNQLIVSFLALPGDAIVIYAPGGGFTLIDGGADPPLLAVRLSQQLPFYERQLRAVIVTGSDGQRLPGAITALRYYQPRQAFAPPDLPRDSTSAEWLRLLSSVQRRPNPLQTGQQIRLGPQTILTVIALDPLGGASLHLRHGQSQLLLHTGGEILDPPAAAIVGPLDLVAIPWARKIDPALLARWQAQAIVFTDGYHAEHPPHLSYAERAAGARQLFHERTDGTITLISDGRRSRITTTGP